MKLAIGNLITKVGPHNTNVEQMKGKHGCGNRNDFKPNEFLKTVYCEIKCSIILAQNLQPFKANGDVSKWWKNSRVGRKTPYKQNKQTSILARKFHLRITQCKTTSKERTNYLKYSLTFCHRLDRTKHYTRTNKMVASGQGFSKLKIWPEDYVPIGLKRISQ